MHFGISAILHLLKFVFCSASTSRSMHVARQSRRLSAKSIVTNFCRPSSVSAILLKDSPNSLPSFCVSFELFSHEDFMSWTSLRASWKDVVTSAHMLSFVLFLTAVLAGFHLFWSALALSVCCVIFNPPVRFVFPALRPSLILPPDFLSTTK